MEAIFKKILLASVFVAALAGCTRVDELETGGNAPDGYYQLDIRFVPTDALEVLTRVDSDPLLSNIDDVHLMIFTDDDSNPDNVLGDSAPLYLRQYYEYGKTQRIYLKRHEVYYVYAVANLDNSNIPGNGTVADFFSDVETYGDLKKKYVQFRVRSPRELKKMIMTTDNPKVLTEPNEGELGGGIIKIVYSGEIEKFTPNVPLYKAQAKFVVNIYNRINSLTGEILSGVTPTSISAQHFPRNSYVVQRPYDYADGEDGDGIISDPGRDFYNSAEAFLSPAGSTYYKYDYATNAAYQNSYYTRQTVEFFCFENRRGRADLEGYEPVDAEGNVITHYDDGTPVGDVPNVYGRFDNAPKYSSYIALLSLTDEGAMRTYMHAGQGRTKDDPDTMPDDIGNYDVDRNCVYNFNVIINSTKDVFIDTRREYLAQRVLYYFPEDQRVDAHYVDMPSYISGLKGGYVHLQAGTVKPGALSEDANGDIIITGFEADGVTPLGWEPMPLKQDPKSWLRFSWIDPYNPTRGMTIAPNYVTETGPTTSELYVLMSDVDGTTGATPILHFDEFVSEDAVTPFPPSTTNPKNPPRRTAVIRVGFIEGVTTRDEYVAAADAKQNEYPFFIPVTQYGLKTIGQIGGWDSAKGRYTMMLGVESIEEHTLAYYKKENSANRQDYNLTDGPYWTYGGATNTDFNRPYDGKTATTLRYEAWSAAKGGVLPVRWGDAMTPTGVTTPADPDLRKMYNPFFNTNAVDYCMRKNRDENGNGKIDPDEVKWYLPSPAQLMQIYAWRDAFRGGTYTLNDGTGQDGHYDGTAPRSYTPFGIDDFVFYWTANEADASNALTVMFSKPTVDFPYAPGESVARSKTDRYAARCVRDIDVGDDEMSGMIYPVDDFIVVDLTDYLPEENLAGFGKGDINNWGVNQSIDGSNNKIANAFIISRWYVGPTISNGGAKHTGNPSLVNADDGKGSNSTCGNYYEAEPFDQPDYWYRPATVELSYIYAYAGVIEKAMNAKYTSGPGPDTYHNFIGAHDHLGNAVVPETAWHWAANAIGSASDNRWQVNFISGASRNVKKNADKAYRRCVRYLTKDELNELRDKVGKDPIP